MSSQVIALSIANSQTRNKRDKETLKGGSVYSERQWNNTHRYSKWINSFSSK
jgi:hypothetical protein